MKSQGSVVFVCEENQKVDTFSPASIEGEMLSDTFHFGSIILQMERRGSNTKIIRVL